MTRLRNRPLPVAERGLCCRDMSRFHAISAESASDGRPTTRLTHVTCEVDPASISIPPLTQDGQDPSSLQARPIPSCVPAARAPAPRRCMGVGNRTSWDARGQPDLATSLVVFCPPPPPAAGWYPIGITRLFRAAGRSPGNTPNSGANPPPARLLRLVTAMLGCSPLQGITTLVHIRAKAGHPNKPRAMPTLGHGIRTRSRATPVFGHPPRLRMLLGVLIFRRFSHGLRQPHHQRLHGLLWRPHGLRRPRGMDDGLQPPSSWRRPHALRRPHGPQRLNSANLKACNDPKWLWRPLDLRQPQGILHSAVACGPPDGLAIRDSKGKVLDVVTVCVTACRLHVRESSISRGTVSESFPASNWCSAFLEPLSPPDALCPRLSALVALDRGTLARTRLPPSHHRPCSSPSLLALALCTSPVMLVALAPRTSAPPRATAPGSRSPPAFPLRPRSSSSLPCSGCDPHPRPPPDCCPRPAPSRHRPRFWPAVLPRRSPPLRHRLRLHFACRGTLSVHCHCFAGASLRECSTSYARAARDGVRVALSRQGLDARVGRCPHIGRPR